KRSSPWSTTDAAIAVPASARTSSKQPLALISKSSTVSKRRVPRLNERESSVERSTARPSPRSDRRTIARPEELNHADHCRQTHLVQRQARSVGKGDSACARTRVALRLHGLRGRTSLRDRPRTGHLQAARPHAQTVRFGEDLSHRDSLHAR